MAFDISSIIKSVAGSGSSDEEATVLVVDDEHSVADMYGAWLEGSYDVKVAYGGKDALEKLDDDVDVVLLDRRMPRMTGDEVLEEILERDLDCQVSMVTAIEPEFDIVDMDFDHYVTKPVEREELHESVEYLLAREELDEREQERHTMSLKKSILEDTTSENELEESDEFEKLNKELEKLDRSTNDEEIDDFFTNR